MISRLDVIRNSSQLTLLQQIPETEIAVFQGEIFVTLASVAQLLALNEMDILKVFKNFEWVTADLEFDERSHRLTIHDGESYTGRPLVAGVTWLGLKCLAMAFDSEPVKQLARDLIIVDFEMSNPKRVAAYYIKKEQLVPGSPSLQFGLKRKS